MSGSSTPSSPCAERVWVHLDLKGAPPTVEYLVALFPLLQRWGATGIVIEWEDMFPWSGILAPLACADAYTPVEVAVILKAAAAHGLEVTPLVQGFGHLEFVLKHSQFAHLRESPTSCMDLCPLHGDSLPLVKELINQTLALHPGCRYLHCGCDEVFGIATCASCQAKAAQSGLETLFLDHVVPLLQHALLAGVTPLVWHDMIEKFSPEGLKQTAGLAECVVWSYHRNVDDFVDSSFWDRALACGLKLWGASAYKGASNPDAVWAPMAHHAANTASWMARARVTHLQGMILTGWSRFTHFASLCELLPAGIPSLALCLAVIKARGWEPSHLHPHLLHDLGLPSLPIPTNFKAKVHVELGKFPGARTFQLLAELESANAMLARCSDSVRMYCPPATHRCDPAMWTKTADGLRQVVFEVTQLREPLETALRQCLRPGGVAEFLQAKLDAVVAQAEAMIVGLSGLLNKFPGVTDPCALIGVQIGPAALPFASIASQAVQLSSFTVSQADDASSSSSGASDEADDSDMGSGVSASQLQHHIFSDAVLVATQPQVQFSFGSLPVTPVVLPVSPTSTPLRTMLTLPGSAPKTPGSPPLMLPLPALSSDTPMLPGTAMAVTLNVTTTMTTVLSDTVPTSTTVSVMSPSSVQHPSITVYPPTIPSLLSL